MLLAPTAAVTAAELIHKRPPSTFDAEDAPALLGTEFDEVDVHSWQIGPLELPDDAAIENMRAQMIDPALLKPVSPPARVTKWGCTVYGRKTP